MKYLFNSRGKHIANVVGAGLHAPAGANIGHFVEGLGAFVDTRGRYLGEIVQNDRLMYRILAGNESVNYGVFGNAGNAGNYGNPGNAGSIGVIGGYRDLDVTWK
jgi:hypothetical protein